MNPPNLPKPQPFNPQMKSELEKVLGEKKQLQNVKNKYDNTFQKKPKLNEGMSGTNREVYL